MHDPASSVKEISRTRLDPALRHPGYKNRGITGVTPQIAYVNPRNNLAHCFGCRNNLNTIDLLGMLGYDFTAAVAILEGWLDRHQSRLPMTPTTREAK